MVLALLQAAIQMQRDVKNAVKPGAIVDGV